MRTFLSYSILPLPNLFYLPNPQRIGCRRLEAIERTATDPIHATAGMASWILAVVSEMAAKAHDSLLRFL